MHQTFLEHPELSLGTSGKHLGRALKGKPANEAPTSRYSQAASLGDLKSKVFPREADGFRGGFYRLGWSIVWLIRIKDACPCMKS